MHIFSVVLPFSFNFHIIRRLLVSFFATLRTICARQKELRHSFRYLECMCVRLFFISSKLFIFYENTNSASGSSFHFMPSNQFYTKIRKFLPHISQHTFTHTFKHTFTDSLAVSYSSLSLSLQKLTLKYIRWNTMQGSKFIDS